MGNLANKLRIEENADDKVVKFPYLVLAISIILTVGVTLLFYQSARSKDSIRFNNQVYRIQSATENKVNLYIALLKGGRGFVDLSQNLNRATFANYVASLELQKNYSGILGIGYSKVVLPEEREALIRQMKSEGLADFKIFPDGERESYQAVIYLEPSDERNKKAIGFDMSSDEIRRQAMFRARDLGAPATTSKVTLIRANEIEPQPGFLIYLPVYKDGKLPATLEERRQNIAGYIYSPFRAVDFLDAIQREIAPTNISVKLYDRESKPENLLSEIKTDESEVSPASLFENFSTQSNLDIAGQRWVIEYTALNSFAGQSTSSWTPLIFLTGVIFSFLIFGTTYAEASSRARSQIVAAELFKLEQQKQDLLEKEQKARLEAEQANTTKDEFISLVSHELRTPLNAIAGWTKILNTENLAENTKRLALQKIEKNLRAQTGLVEELLDFSQIMSGKINLETQAIDFTEVLEIAYSEIEPGARKKDIEFIKQNQLNGEKFTGDRERIKIVLCNLLSNAVKFSAPGGKVEVSAFENKGNIQLEVKDYGKGISREFLPFIFDRFRQADASSTRFYGGLGLGLAISEHIIKLHNGTIEAQSEGKDKGSVFTVRIPCKSE